LKADAYYAAIVTIHVRRLGAERARKAAVFIFAGERREALEDVGHNYISCWGETGTAFLSQ
jgi:hypothetical protein